MLYPEGSVLTAGRPRSCTPRDRFCGPYNIAIAIIVGAVPLGIGAESSSPLAPSISLAIVVVIIAVVIVGAVPLGIGDACVLHSSRGITLGWTWTRCQIDKQK